MAWSILPFSLFSNETLGRFKDIHAANQKTKDITPFGFQKKINDPQLAS
jgi:hypothetical protein